jgi:rhamnosyltransferase
MSALFDKKKIYIVDHDIGNKRVAVLLAAWSGIRWIEDQVCSILSQVGPQLDLFISVDISFDGTYELCQSLSSKFSNVSVLQYGEGFGGAARNFFRLIRDVDFSNYDYVALSDQDDLWFDNKLARAIAQIEFSQSDAFSSDVVAFWEDSKKTVLLKKSFPQKKFDYFFESAGPGCTYILRRDTMQAFKQFLIYNWCSANQVKLHDWMIYAFCRSRSKNWYIDSEPLMRYRQHNGNQFGANSGMKQLLARLLMIKSKWYRGEVEKIVDLVDPYKQSGFSLENSFLIKNCWQLRRRSRDAWILLFILILRIF